MSLDVNGTGPIINDDQEDIVQQLLGLEILDITEDQEELPIVIPMNADADISHIDFTDLTVFPSIAVSNDNSAIEASEEISMPVSEPAQGNNNNNNDNNNNNNNNQGINNDNRGTDTDEPPKSKRVLGEYCHISKCPKPDCYALCCRPNPGYWRKERQNDFDKGLTSTMSKELRELFEKILDDDIRIRGLRLRSFIKLVNSCDHRLRPEQLGWHTIHNPHSFFNPRTIFSRDEEGPFFGEIKTKYIRQRRPCAIKTLKLRKLKPNNSSGIIQRDTSVKFHIRRQALADNRISWFSRTR